MSKPADADPVGPAGFLEAVLIGMSARARHRGGRAELDAVADQTMAVLPRPARPEAGA